MIYLQYSKMTAILFKNVLEILRYLALNLMESNSMFSQIF